ncbi:NUDIX hydrolase [Candidatus Methylocalor cossyra]|uniref:Nudix hydrolase domain-containing protein n=1 Tax=Candidatus Methylocalor cossyra TaxID=3108543 RepID=A0ABM9NJ32_9GAMM
MSDRPWDGGRPPDGLAEALADNWLGNPATVNRLVGGYVDRVGDLAARCWDEKKSGDWLAAELRREAEEMATIFTGGDPAYRAPAWNTAQLAGLATRARGLLTRWKNNGSGDYEIDPKNPVASLFYALGCQTLSAFKAASRGEDYPLPRAMAIITEALLGMPLGSLVESIDDDGNAGNDDDLAKGHVHGYVKRDGTTVTGYERADGKTGAAKAIAHPRRDERGQPVLIQHPDTPTGAESWSDPSVVAVFTPGSPVPDALNGIAVTPWKDHPVTLEGWDFITGTRGEFEEPKLPPLKGRKLAAGVMIEEPDGRVWVVSPTNGFGGYRNVFPKGTADPDLSVRGTALKEAYEETGLKVRLTGWVGDFPRTTSVMRLYRGVRIGGSPADMGWESQAVKLVPKARLADYLDAPADQTILEALKVK